MGKKYSLFLFLMMLVLVLSACSEGDSASGDGGSGDGITEMTLKFSHVVLRTLRNIKVLSL